MNDRTRIETAHEAMKEYQQAAQDDLLGAIDTRLRVLGSEMVGAEIDNDTDLLRALKVEKAELFGYKNLIVKNQTEISKLFDKISPSTHVSSIANDITQRATEATVSPSQETDIPDDSIPVSNTSTDISTNAATAPSHAPSKVTILVGNGHKMHLRPASEMNGVSRTNGNYTNNKPRSTAAPKQTHVDKNHNPSSVYEPFILRTLLRYEDTKPFPEFAFIREATIDLMKREGAAMPGDEEQLETGKPRSFSQIESKKGAYTKQGLIYLAHPKVYRLTDSGLTVAKQYQTEVDQRRLTRV